MINILQRTFLYLSFVPALLWMSLLLDWLMRGRHLPRLKDQPMEPEARFTWPALAVVVPARNEEKKIEQAIRSLASQDYPRLRIIVVNDRSTDSTPSILMRLAKEFPQLTLASIDEVPRGWLGKTNALFQGTRFAKDEEWLLFTDADVFHAPGTLRRAILYAEKNELDLLSLYPQMEMHGLWERAMISYFSLVGVVGYAPWRVNHPKSGAYFAVGAFILVRRERYERAGSHRALALEVVDDVRLCRLMKRAGARVKILIGRGCIRIRWQEGLRGIVDGLTKNMFASLNFSFLRAGAASIGMIVLSVFPFLGLLGFPQRSAWVCSTAVFSILLLYLLVLRATEIHFLFGLSHPVAAVIMVYIILRSATRAWRQGGVVWRDTFYSLEELKKGRRDVKESPQ